MAVFRNSLQYPFTSLEVLYYSIRTVSTVSTLARGQEQKQEKPPLTTRRIVDLQTILCSFRGHCAPGEGGGGDLEGEQKQEDDAEEGMQPHAVHHPLPHGLAHILRLEVVASSAPPPEVRAAAPKTNSGRLIHVPFAGCNSAFQIR